MNSNHSDFVQQVKNNSSTFIHRQLIIDSEEKCLSSSYQKGSYFLESNPSKSKTSRLFPEYPDRVSPFDHHSKLLNNVNYSSSSLELESSPLACRRGKGLLSNFVINFPGSHGQPFSSVCMGREENELLEIPCSVKESIPLLYSNHFIIGTRNNHNQICDDKEFTNGYSVNPSDSHLFTLPRASNFFAVKTTAKSQVEQELSNKAKRLSKSMTNLSQAFENDQLWNADSPHSTKMSTDQTVIRPSAIGSSNFIASPIEPKSYIKQSSCSVENILPQWVSRSLANHLNPVKSIIKENNSRNYVSTNVSTNINESYLNTTNELSDISDKSNNFSNIEDDCLKDLQCNNYLVREPSDIDFDLILSPCDIAKESSNLSQSSNVHCLRGTYKGSFDDNNNEKNPCNNGPIIHDIVNTYRIYNGGNEALQPLQAVVSEGDLMNYFHEHVCNTLKIKKQIKRLQSFAWPAISSDGASCFLIGGKNCGKTIGYIVPMVSNLLDNLTLKKGKQPKGVGPVMIVLCSSWVKVIKTAEDMDAFVPNRLLKIVPAWGGMGEDQESSLKCQLLTACDILITTAPCLKRLMITSAEEVTLDCISFPRCSYLVIDDADKICAVSAKDFKFIIEEWILSFRSCSNNDTKQLVITGDRWSENILTLYNSVSSVLQTRIIISAHLEAAIAVKVKNIIHYTKPHQSPYNIAVNLMKNSLQKSKTIIFVSSDSNGELLKNLLGSVAISAQTVSEQELMWQVKSTISNWNHSSTFVIIVSDQICNQLYQYDLLNADSIIHIGIPDSELLFNRRFSFMLANYPNDINEKCQVTSHIILSSDMVQRRSYIIPSLERMRTVIPIELKDAHDKNILATLKLKENTELCYYVKAFGKCEKRKCRWRHKIIQNDIIDTLPSSGVIEFKILYVIDASRYFISLSKFTDQVTNDMIDFGNLYNLMFMKLDQFFRQLENQKLIELTNIGMLCAVCYEKNIWARAKIIAIGKRNPGNITIFLIDKGLTQMKNINSIYCLPDDFTLMPPLCFEVFLCDIKPIDNDKMWTLMANNFMKTLLQNSNRFIGKIRFSLQSKLWLGPIKPMVLIGSKLLAKESLRSQLCSLKFGEDNPTHMSDLQELFHESELMYSKSWFEKFELGKNSLMDLSFEKDLSDIASKQIEHRPIEVSKIKFLCCSESSSCSSLSNSFKNTSMIHTDKHQGSTMNLTSINPIEDKRNDQTTKLITANISKLVGSKEDSFCISFTSSDDDDRHNLSNNGASVHQESNINEQCYAQSKIKDNGSDLINVHDCIEVNEMGLLVKNYRNIEKQEQAQQWQPSIKKPLNKSFQKDDCNSEVIPHERLEKSELPLLNNSYDTQASVEDLGLELFSVTDQSKDLVTHPKPVNPLERKSLYHISNDEIIVGEEIMKLKDILEVEVAEIVTPLNFYCMKKMNFIRLELLENEIQSLIGCMRIFEEGTAGDSCIAKFTDERFYRGKILNVLNETCTIFFIDHGETIERNKKEIYPCPPYIYKALPAQAMKCQLGNIVIPENQLNKATKLMEKIVDSTSVWMIEVLDIQNEAESIVYIVDLIDTTRTENKFLTQYLIEEGLMFEDKSTSKVLEIVEVNSIQHTSFCSATESDACYLVSQESIPCLNPTTDTLSEPVCMLSSNLNQISDSTVGLPKDSLIGNTSCSTLEVPSHCKNIDLEYLPDRSKNKNTDSSSQSNNYPNVGPPVSENELQSEFKMVSPSFNGAKIDLQQQPMNNVWPPLEISTLIRPKVSHPITYWYQDEDKIYLRFDLPNVSEYECRTHSNGLLFQTSIKNTMYFFDEEFFTEIVPDKYLVQTKGLYTTVNLEKRQKGIWPRIFSKEGPVPPWLRKDVQTIVDDDDTDSFESYFPPAKVGEGPEDEFKKLCLQSGRSDCESFSSSDDELFKFG